MATAKHRAIDALRRDAMRRAQARTRSATRRRRRAARRRPSSDAALDDDVGDDLLRLIFIACHPGAVDRRRASRSRCGCSAASPPTRSRARSWCPSRRSRSASCAPNARWPRSRCRSRCRAAPSSASGSSSVLEVVYLIFNEGYSATAGDDWMRPALCEDALRLGRDPRRAGAGRSRSARPRRADGDPGLAVARARVGPDGEPILLLDQDRARWDQLLIHRGLAALERAMRLRPERCRARTRCRPRSPRAMRARGAPRTPTGRASPRSTTRSLAIAPSPVVELNRAVAVGMASGPAAALAIVDALLERAGAQALPPAAERPRRSADEARPARGGAARVLARGGADAQRARARAAAPARRSRVARGRCVSAA